MDLPRQNSRTRLLVAAKKQMAEAGYERTSTATIARAAATSESQLIRNFGSKAGLLEALFDASWERLNRRFEHRMATAVSARDAIHDMLAAMMKIMAEDPDLAFLLMFEGRRLRGKQSEVVLSSGFQQFIELFCGLIKRGQQDGSFARELHPSAVTSAILGAVEGMMRDRFMNERFCDDEPFSTADLQTTFQAILAGFAPLQ